VKQKQQLIILVIVETFSIRVTGASVWTLAFRMFLEVQHLFCWGGASLPIRWLIWTPSNIKWLSTVVTPTRKKQLTKQQSRRYADRRTVCTIIKTTSIGDGTRLSVIVGVAVCARGRLTLSCCDAERYRCACFCTAHRGWLGVVTVICAASTGGGAF